jgi:hypothetical protein
MAIVSKEEEEEVDDDDVSFQNVVTEALLDY